jgi:cell wall-associated NlpC family hydrolase
MKDSLVHMKTIRDMMRLSAAPDADIYRDLLACFNGTPYAWGGSSPSGCDCSGSVCTALNVLYGTDRDVTADTLYKLYFTQRSDGDDALCAVFFIDRNGKAVHVAGRLGDDFYMNVSRTEPEQKGTIRSYNELKAMYPLFRMVQRSLQTGAWK